VVSATTVVARIRQVPDPELPVVSIDDLGILRDVSVGPGTVTVTITPTYSGCPAMDAIRADIEAACAAEGYAADVRTVLSPAWTTDWISEAGRQALQEYGVAPPRPLFTIEQVMSGRAWANPSCPQCGSSDTREISRFGSTACKALWACNSCLEPFDHFKEL
jgi:ring-1,2-phenylacetyl-CoA epoxidase subunit PaaD